MTDKYSDKLLGGLECLMGGMFGTIVLHINTLYAARYEALLESYLIKAPELNEKVYQKGMEFVNNQLSNLNILYEVSSPIGALVVLGIVDGARRLYQAYQQEKKE